MRVFTRGGRLGLVAGPAVVGLAFAAAGCSSRGNASGYDGVPRQAPGAAAAAPSSAPAVAHRPMARVEADPATGALRGGYRGFDRNQYPGDAAMAAMRSGDGAFAFTGYWLTPPPGASTNSWNRKRDVLRGQGWGFLLLANGKLDREILKARRSGTAADALGRGDAAAAVNAARAEGFPRGAILFLDQEEGGRLLAEQAAYLLGWTEAVAATEYRPGVYASGQPVPEEPTPGDPHPTITTIRDIRARVLAGKLHEIAMFDAQDACPPAPGCTVKTQALSAAGEPDLNAWQYAQSPRRPDITRSCAATYAADGNCYARGAPGVFLDMDVASSPDPSRGR